MAIDWDKGDKLILLGQYSAAEIAKRLGCARSTVTRRMDKIGHIPDVSKIVTKRTAEAIAMQHATQHDATSIGDSAHGALSEDEINVAVQTNLALVMSHRKDIQRLANVEQKILSELEGDPTKLYLAQYKGELVEKTVSLTTTEKAAALQSLANVQAKRIEKQRQAFGIDGNSAAEEEVDNINITMVRANGQKT